MSILEVLVVLAVAGAVLWAVNTYVPMAANIKTLLNVAVAVILVGWLLQQTGLIGALSQGRVQ